MSNENYPPCYGDIETVFPMGENNIRTSPDYCMLCHCKTLCLRDAMKEHKIGPKVQEEFVDRAYDGGMINFMERWSKKKTLQRKTEKKGFFSSIFKKEKDNS
jgi:hypothetical protein